MQVYFEYALKVSLSLAVIFLFYTLLLKRMTYYIWNRYFLLLFSFLSFIVPFINISVFVKAPQKTAVSFINEIPSLHSYEVTGEMNNPAMIIYLHILFAVFLLVSFVLVLRLFIQLLSIRKMQLKSALLVAGKERIYHISKPILPFSFFNSIFINTSNYSHDELQEIIEHERVHVQQKHSIDMIISEIICIFNWYNPFAWIIKKAIRENLEFIADDAVISKGADKKNYQYLLLKVTGRLHASFTSGLKFSSLRNRIIMMNKTKTSKLYLLKFVLLVPIITLLLLAFRNKGIKQSNTETVKAPAAETYTLSTLTYSISNEKAKAIVLKEKDKSLLKAGADLNLKQIFKEKDRLKSLLETNGYNNLKSNAIMFWIDTISVKNSFSIEVKIDVEPPVASISKKISSSVITGIISINEINLHLSDKANSKEVFASVKTLSHSYIPGNKPTSFI